MAAPATAATVNDTTIKSPWPYRAARPATWPAASHAGGMLEGGIDLTDLGLTGCFSSFMAETRSSPQIGAQLKDFVLGTFESCGSAIRPRRLMPMARSKSVARSTTPRPST